MDLSPNAAWPAQALAALVVKQGVGLGGLPAGQRDLALAWVWAGLPQSRNLSESQVNQALISQLAAAASFLDTDHVELRRWLVDTGWLCRDTYGREYRRATRDALAPAQRPLADALAGIDTSAWAAAARTARRELREARREAWQSGQGGAA